MILRWAETDAKAAPHVSHFFTSYIRYIYLPSFAENEMPWSGFQVTWKCIHQHQRIIILIDPVNLHLVNTKIRHHHKLFVRCHTDTALTWTEHTLCHTSQSLMVNTGCDTADGSIGFRFITVALPSWYPATNRYFPSGSTEADSPSFL